MGCGSSQVGVAGTEGGTQTQTQKQQNHGGSGDHKSVSSHGTVNGVSSKHKIHNNNTDTKKDPNDNTVRLDHTPVPKSVAFDVTLDGKDTALFPTRTKPMPKRLQVLEPLDLPKLTADQLEEKIRLAEEKRNRVLQKKANASKKASRRRQELMKAKEFEQQQQVHQEKALDDQLKQVEMKREARLREIQDKQRLREERAKRARERAKRLNNPDDSENIDVEKDDHFNASDGDSWLGEDEAHERGRRADQPEPQKRTLGNRQTASASTVDSYDAAFQRQPRAVLPQGDNHHSLRDDDDFFGS